MSNQLQFVISSQYFTFIEDIQFIDARNSCVSSIKQSNPLHYSPVNQPITTFSLAALRHPQRHLNLSLFHGSSLKMQQCLLVRHLILIAYTSHKAICSVASLRALSVCSECYLKAVIRRGQSTIQCHIETLSVN